MKNKKKEIIKNINLFFLGDSSVGKTSFFTKIATGLFSEKNNISTIGRDKCRLYFNDIEINLNDKDRKEAFNINLYDTSGQESFRALTKIYYHSTDVVFLLYDVTYRKSFDDLGEWLKEIKEKLYYCMIGHYIIFVLGNKIDMIGIEDKKRETTEEEAENFCKEKGIEWGGECSAKIFTKDELSNILLKAWKKFVEKFGIKENVIKKAKVIEGNKRKRGYC